MRTPEQSLTQIRSEAMRIRELMRNDGDRTEIAVGLNNIIILTGGLP